MLSVSVPALLQHQVRQDLEPQILFSCFSCILLPRAKMVQVLYKITIPIISSCYPKISKEQSTSFLHKKAMASSRKYQGFHLVFWRLLGFTCCLWIPQRASSFSGPFLDPKGSLWIPQGADPCFPGRFKDNLRMEFGWGGQRFPPNRWRSKWSGLKIQMCDPKVNHSPALASSSTEIAISKDTDFFFCETSLYGFW